MYFCHGIHIDSMAFILVSCVIRWFDVFDIFDIFDIFNIFDIYDIFYILDVLDIFDICPTLRSWLHETSALIMTLSPGLEKNDTSEWSSNSFPGTTCMSGCLKNCQKSVPKSWGYPIQGTISDFLLNYGTDLSPCFYTF